MAPIILTSLLKDLVTFTRVLVACHCLAEGVSPGPLLDALTCSFRLRKVAKGRRGGAKGWALKIKCPNLGTSKRLAFRWLQRNTERTTTMFGGPIVRSTHMTRTLNPKNLGSAKWMPCGAKPSNGSSFSFAKGSKKRFSCPTSFRVLENMLYFLLVVVKRFYRDWEYVCFLLPGTCLQMGASQARSPKSALSHPFLGGGFPY